MFHITDSNRVRKSDINCYVINVGLFLCRQVEERVERGEKSFARVSHKKKGESIKEILEIRGNRLFNDVVSGIDQNF